MRPDYEMSLVTALAPYGSFPHARDCEGSPTQLTGNKITNISNAHPHYKRDYIVPKYGGPIVIYSEWKVCLNISPEHSKLKRIPKPSQDNIITA